jgi:hypothetical protein
MELFDRSTGAQLAIECNENWILKETHLLGVLGFHALRARSILTWHVTCRRGNKAPWRCFLFLQRVYMKSKTVLFPFVTMIVGCSAINVAKNK